MKIQRIVIALGGNAIQNKGEKGTYAEQLANVTRTMEAVVPLVRDEKTQVIITHGNGPQVGAIMIQQQASAAKLPEMPMHMCGAMTQGQIGYLIQMSLRNLLEKGRIAKEVATIITQTVVDEKSDGFRNPSKPVGPHYTEEQARQIAARDGFVFREDAGRGWRRVVPSPRPLRLAEIGTIRALADRGTVVIASGGGGIPVVDKSGSLEGVDAVIDKDRAAALLANELGAGILVILTAVEKVALSYGKPDEKKLDRMNVSQACRYLEEGHFAPGSMGPKIEAAISYLEKNNKGRVIITHAHTLTDALAGKNGTVITY